MPSNSETTPDTGARWLRGSISSACPPIVSVFVLLLGAVALVLTPLEKLLYQSDGVKYVYSQSLPGRSVVTVRFYVGEDREASLVKIYNKIQSNIDAVPPGVDAWVIKPVEVDDVPIVVAALWRDDPGHIDDHGLRRMAEEVERELKARYGKGTVAQAALDSSEANLRAANAEVGQTNYAVSEAQTVLSYTRIVSPLARKVVDRFYR